jgi:hypothetical protein
MTKKYCTHKYITHIDVDFSAMTMDDLTGKCIAKENLPVVPGSPATFYE